MLQIAKQNKKRVLAVVWSLVGIAWLVLGSIFFLTENQTTAIVALTIVAIVTEVAFWLTALLLGIAIVDARKALWGKLTGKNRSSFEGQA